MGGSCFPPVRGKTGIALMSGKNLPTAEETNLHTFFADRCEPGKAEPHASRIGAKDVLPPKHGAPEGRNFSRPLCLE